MTPQQALVFLTSNPQQFFQNNMLQIAGSPAASAVTNFGIHYHLAAPVGPTGARAFKIDLQANAQAQNPHQLFPAHSVQMVEYTTLVVPPAVPGAAPAPIVLNGYLFGGGGPGVMVTGQLTGCAFCVLQVGGNLVCTHIRPTLGHISGAALHTLLTNRAEFNGYPGQRPIIFGRNFYPGNATVFGARIGGQWQLYGQQLTGGIGFGPATRIV